VDETIQGGGVVMKKILTVVGARPQFIKAATVSRAIRQRSDMREVVLHTGQHFDSNMSDIFFEELHIPRPDHHLGIHGGSHGAMTGQMLAKIEEVLLEEKPHWLLVYGDTNSTLAGALAAVKLHIPVAHVEAGLRSFNRRMPEEINRVLTDHASSLLFAPTRYAVENLEHEGIDTAKIKRTGDVMCDAAFYYAQHAKQNSEILNRLGLQQNGYALATLHRAENTDDEQRLRGVIDCLNLAAKELPIILPLHPRTRQAIERLHPAVLLVPNVRVVDPVGYLDMVMLEMNARVVITDSGGVQKEAYFHRVPCITLRDETEWVELIDSGWNRLAGADPDRFARAFDAALNGAIPVWSADLYGDGHAAESLVEYIAVA
jgi:UDP-GlcNAc3NAcA epimerase